MAATPALVTPALDTAAGRPLRELLPQGADAPRWRRWQNEIQMLLHAHPVNQARASRGRAAATSVWFWGGGRASAMASRAGAIATWGGDRVAVALAHAAGASARALPTELAPVLATAARRCTSSCCPRKPGTARPPAASSRRRGRRCCADSVAR